jgi:protein involved in polysaccharide export with SLBB domain
MDVYEFANKKNIKIISDGEIRLFELKDILMEKIDYKPNPNDQIIFMKSSLYTIPGTVLVSGAIKQPGLYPVKKNGLPLKQVLLNAGGKLGNALENGVQIFRDSLRLGWQSDQMLILDGDSISVLYDQNTIEVMGGVNAPGIYGMTQKSITIRSALKMAGGISPSGSDKRIYIIYPNGMVKSKGFLISPELVSGSQLVIGVKSPDEYRSALETTEKLAGIVGSLATLLLVINSTTIRGN